jgi:hypothetical protein
VAINFPIYCGRLCFYFRFLELFDHPPLLLQWPTVHSTAFCLVSMCLNIFSSSFCYWVLFLFFCGRQDILALCPKICLAEQNVYRPGAGWHILYINKLSLLILRFLLIFCLDVGNSRILSLTLSLWRSVLLSPVVFV